MVLPGKDQPGAGLPGHRKRHVGDIRVKDIPVFSRIRHSFRALREGFGIWGPARYCKCGQLNPDQQPVLQSRFVTWRPPFCRLRVTGDGRLL